MAMVVRTQKGLMTKRINSILTWLTETESLLTTPSETDRRKCTGRCHLALKTCDEHIALLESSLSVLAGAYEEIKNRSEEDDKAFDRYVSNAQDTIMALQARKDKLRHVLQEAQDYLENNCEGTQQRSLMSLSKLPQIPIPTFSGKRWEWDNFLALFNASVHEQDLTDLQKFNYLLSALTGQARHAVARFQITAANYGKALEHLKKRYGRKDGILLDLHESLKFCTARGPSTEDQRQLFEKLSAIAAQLKEHGENLDSYLTVHMFLQKFHRRIQKAAMKKHLRYEPTFQQQDQDTPAPQQVEWSMDFWLDTIEDVISEEEQLKDMMFSKPDKSSSQHQSYAVRADGARRPINCEYCGQKGHRWNSCSEISTPLAKRKFLMESNRCLNCGSSAHRLAMCTSGNCRNCYEKHHTATCTKTREEQHDGDLRRSTTRAESRAPKQSLAGVSKPKHTKTSKQHVVTTERKDVEQDTIVLQTHKRTQEKMTARNKVVLLVGHGQVLDSNNRTQEATVLLDTGSELSFIHNGFADELGLPIIGNTTLSISTFGSQSSSSKKIEISPLQLCDIEGRRHEIRVHRSEYITGTIEQADLTRNDLAFISEHGVALSKKQNSPTVEPQILLGCDYLWDFMMPLGKLVLPSGLHLIPTKLGYIISGQQSQVTLAPPKIFTVTNTNEDKETWDRYWSLESTGTNEFTGPAQSERQQINNMVQEEFRNTIQRRDDGYYVRLPWKANFESLPDNKSIALKRLYKLLDMYARDIPTLQQYDDIFKDQLKKGIIEGVSHEHISEGIIHYLPHQAVITPAKETTKMRIVFDASAHYKDKPCLNDALHQGPLMLPDMVSILLRFRAHKIAIISDVEKAFLQVRLQESDRDATRCLWVRSIFLPPTPENIVTYRFTRVTFGLNTSPFLLASTINYHLDVMNSEREMAKEIKDNLYVDNLIMGAQSQDEALVKYQVAKDIFKGLNMNLREFLSNDEVFNNMIDNNDRAKASWPKVLGILWNTKNDRILLRGTMATCSAVTKRTVSIQLASVYDPLGLLVPVLLPAKVFLQSLWKEEYSWDTSLSPDLQDQWRVLSTEISTYYREIERKAVERHEEATMFVFTDASQIAMAACVYIGSRSGIKLVMAKSKLPSLKTATTIPKLEMNALTLGARLAHFVHSSLCTLQNIRHMLLFTDSEIVLGWIRSPPNRKTAGVLVSNRLKEIRSIVKDLKERGVTCLFGHIPTADNPADCGTRGFTTSPCGEHIWWNGPPFIRNVSLKEKMYPICNQDDDAEEETAAPIKVASLLTVREKELDKKTTFDLTRFSSMFKAQRVVAYVFRFIRRTIAQFPKIRQQALCNTIPALNTASSKHELTGIELHEAKKAIIRDHQRTLVSDQHVKTQKALNIRLDNERILRCNGRLQHAAIVTSAKTPIYIAPKTALARLLIWEAHNQYHLGVAHTMSAVRETYWIPKLRQQVSQILRSCVPCQKFNNLPFRYPDTEDLPERRVKRMRPFEHIGLDYFGPLTIRSANSESSKAYGCIFTCATTRLIHIELVEDMSTEKFINCLRRFFARRGVPKTITCDNAPTFLLGEKILQEALKQIIESADTAVAVARREIAWLHITPYAPWQGGFYERLIRSIKQSLYKALGRRKVTFEVLHTMLIEIEAVLNSRPLTSQEERWEQQPIIRPIDFIQRDIILDLHLDSADGFKKDPTYHTPEEAQQLATQQQVEDALKSSLTLTEEFWRLWSTQYLTSLREHHKRQIDSKRGTSAQPQEDTIVLLSEPNQPRNSWSVGRIVELKRNEYDTIREATVELPSKRKVKRPINRIIPLEIGSSTKRNASTSDETASTSSTGMAALLAPQSPKHPYNLRKRRSYQAKEDDI